MVVATRIELVTPSMSTRCSPAELRAHTISGEVQYLFEIGSARGDLRRQKSLHFANQFLEMERLGKDLGILGRLR